MSEMLSMPPMSGWKRFDVKRTFTGILKASRAEATILQQYNHLQHLYPIRGETNAYAKRNTTRQKPAESKRPNRERNQAEDAVSMAPAAMAEPS